MSLGGFRPGSRASEVYFWLTQNPGWHAPQDVGASVDCTTHQAAVALQALLQRGLVERLDKQYRVAST